MTRFNCHCDKFQLMPGYQSAYRRNFSCETAIIKITNDILWFIELKRITSLTYINLSAAFDTVDHGILLNVLKNNLELVVMLCAGLNCIYNQGFVRSTFIRQTWRTRSYVSWSHKEAVQVQCCILHMPAHSRR